MPERFASAEALFDAVRGLIDRLESGGHAAAAAELRSGFGCLNGLTDGWAMFLESVDWVRAEVSRRLPPEDRRTLDRIQADAHRAVYRR